MNDTPVIRSLLETDLYKFTMWQTLLHAFPANDAEYRFVCRNTPAFPLSELCEAVNRELDHLCTLGFSDEELAYLGGLRFMSGPKMRSLEASQVLILPSCWPRT